MKAASSTENNPSLALMGPFRGVSILTPKHLEVIHVGVSEVVTCVSIHSHSPFLHMAHHTWHSHPAHAVARAVVPTAGGNWGLQTDPRQI